MHVAERSRQTVPEVCSMASAVCAGRKSAYRGITVQPKIHTRAMYGVGSSYMTFLLWVSTCAHIARNGHHPALFAPQRWYFCFTPHSSAALEGCGTFCSRPRRPFHRCDLYLSTHTTSVFATSTLLVLLHRWGSTSSYEFPTYRCVYIYIV